MEASIAPQNLPTLSQIPPNPPQPDPQKISRKLLKHGVQPTPKILHNLRKKELQKINRREAKHSSDLTDAQKQAISEESHFQAIKSEYNRFTRDEQSAKLVLFDRLSATEPSVKDWKFTRTMRYSGLQYTEMQMLRIVEGLGYKGQWRHACSVVEWLYNSKEHKHFKSRYLYTKLLTVLGRAKKPREALRGDTHIYPGMAAYHCLSVILGQAGLLKELLNVIETMREKPKKIKNMRNKNWSPELQPDIVVFNAGVSWVFQQLRRNGLRPNGASYGLAMEVMLKSGKYDLVHGIFEKMKRKGESLKALTYKAFWEEGKVDDVVRAVRDMEKRGIIGTRSVYYELARCLCFYGRWQEAIHEVEKLKNLLPKRPLAITFTGMILSSMDGGHVQDCISLYEHCKTCMALDIGLINAMLKVYGRNDMFLKAKELFEETRRNDSGSQVGKHGVKADSFTFSSMLETSASALQWEYFEHVYKEMTLSGHQVDQRKRSSLLVKASEAGKWHLLEHSFNSILEAGEIPPLPFFTEMACQANIQCDYERAVNIFNTMGHAPFQVSFEDWIDFFERNRDRLDQATLIELQEELTRHELRRELTVLNLSRALEFVCEDKVNSVEKVSEDLDKQRQSA
ncbi:hypothetical protein SASPL_139643 [Salvia splendens]|uniref:Uncharacterized protein n=1 Tax=Salvia splendens TaxID=180675 RepID=A0A8X8ZB71_SALSN|nr:hypothetical protein SASPL_139643 [Salvia splendens]